MAVTLAGWRGGDKKRRLGRAGGPEQWIRPGGDGETLATVENDGSNVIFRRVENGTV